MCIQGVARVGEGAEGVAGLLPGAVRALQATKPALVLVAGSWLVLHLADRRTRTAPLAARQLFVLGLLGGLAAADAALETAYLVVPKQEASLATGCCTDLRATDDDRLLPAHELTLAHVAATALVVAGTLAWAARRRGPVPAPRWAPALVALAAVSVPLASAFLCDVAAPAFLHRPEHRCAYCVLAESAPGVVAVAAHLLGVLALGWAAVAAWAARHPETEAWLARAVRRLLVTSAIGYLVAGIVSAAAIVRG
jgi:hypothetical protein